MQLQTVAGQVLYKDHTIVTTPRRGSAPDGDNEAFVPRAVVSWKIPDRERRIMQCVTLQKLYRSIEDARTAALQEAKAWVDRHSLDFGR